MIHVIQSGATIFSGSNLIYQRSNNYHTESGYYAFFQIGTGESLVQAVYTELFVQIVHEKCFQVLRTEVRLITMLYIIMNFCKKEYS